MAGHIFVTRGDLRRLNCDAWLLPTDAEFYVSPGWLKEQEPPLSPSTLEGQERAMSTARLRERIKRQRAIGWGVSKRVVRLGGEVREPAEPAIYLVNMGSVVGESVEWYMEGVRHFVQAAAHDLGGTAPVTRRPRPLIGLPFVGTGAGGAHGIKGDIMRALLGALWGQVDAHHLDIALVLDRDVPFAAAQHERLHAPDGSPGTRHDPWPELDGRTRLIADALASHAAAGKLVLFLGAGVSRGAGLPDWDTLLDALAADAGMDDYERKALRRLHVLDWARIVEGRLVQAGRPLGETVRQHIDAPRYSLGHSLLAALPVKEAVTTNYDDLFEQAAAAAGKPFAVLPYQPAADQERWLLKMHGCVSHPEDIVLTRDDYLRYTDRRAALAGIVQALLITRHMLFVGFSLSDDNFHRIVDEVRKAVRGEDDHSGVQGRFGTALLLRPDTLLEELWRDDLDLTPIATGGEEDITEASCARRLEIFLDYLLAKATSAVLPLLDHSFDGLLTEEQRRIQGILLDLEGKVASTASDSSAWEPIHELLARFHG